ncbi:MAG: FeoB-associated Cys-rich membrane protein [Flavobacteriia bacterium]|nr:FeoB-associated Cys-rich membrane protein [Flavobacteriia bacterium]
MDNIQLFLVITCGLGALFFLIRKWILKPKSSKGNNCGTDCGCH